MPFRSLIAEFKAFAFQGNMIELAVAVVIGAAFSSVIHAMVSDIINPAIGHVVHYVREAKEKTTEFAEEAAAKVHLTTTQPTTAPTTGPATAVAVVPPPPPAAPASPPAAPAAGEAVKAVTFDWVIAGFPIGHFVGELINFVIIAFAIFVLIVKLLGGMVKRVGGTPKPGEPTTKECPECLTIIPVRARRCGHCTTIFEAPPATPDPVIVT